MLNCREHHAGMHERRSVAAISNTFDCCGYLETVKVSAHEHITRIGRSWQQAHMNRDSTVKANAARLNSGGKSGLLNQVLERF